ncbi:MAG: hypothetical protein DHS20C02_14620 [Micavibrio sp.]|nr:MAG: hypothetical protein DHS20C02_14620 [Micavibrio sp.]
MRNFLSILIVVSLVVAGVSPACQFISGKSLYEICGFGNDKPVALIDEALLAYLPDYEPEPEHQELEQDCGFCFAQSNLKLAKAEAVGAKKVSQTNTIDILVRSNPFIKSEKYSLSAPRGPPTLFV